MNTTPKWNNENAVNDFGRFPKENKNLILGDQKREKNTMICLMQFV